MAEKQAGGLSMRIGIALSELQSDFLQAEQTVRQGIAALNRQQNIVRLRMETDVAGLDSFTDKTKIIEVREQALSQLLEMQRDKLTLATKAFQDYTSGKNVNATESKRLETAMERERLAVARLESELKKLSAQKVSIDVSGLQSNIEKISARIQNIRIKAEVDTSQLQGANAAFDAQKIHIAAVTKELELQRKKLVELQEIRRQLEKTSGSDSVQTINIKSNILRQIQEINQLETKLKELNSTNVNLQFRADSIRNVEVAIQENIARINARIDNIRIKSEIDTSKLGTAATEFDKAKVHVAALNQELTLQKQKLTELQAAMYNSAKASGSNSSQTIKLRGEILKQIQAIDQLKAKIEELNKIQPPKTNKLLSGYLNIKGNVVGQLSQITSAFSGLSTASQSADGAITKTLEIIGSIPAPVGKAVVAIGALVGFPLLFKALENSIVDMAKAAAASGDSVYVMSRGFQMSLADTGKFTSMCKIAGVEVNDLASTVRRMQQQIIRGGDNTKAENWLKRYGESAFDASGHLKNLNDTTLTLNRALKRAQAEGNGMAFILGTVRTASADAITAIEDAEDNYRKAANVIKTGLIDPKFAHDVQGEINELNEQTGKANANFKAALLPVAHEIVPELTKRMARLAQVIADNKDVIKDFGRAGAEAFLKIEKGAETVISAIGSVAKFFSNLKKNPREQEIIEKYRYDTDIKTVDDLIKKEQPKAFDVIKENPRLYWQVKGIYEPLFKALNDVQEEIRRKNEAIAKELGNAPSVANFSQIGQERQAIEQNPEVLDALRKARKIQEEADEIYNQSGRTDYESKIAAVQKWRNDVLRETELSIEERDALEELYKAKIFQIEKEKEQKLVEIRQRITAGEQTELEKRIADIEREKQTWIQAGMEKAEAEQLAQQKLSSYVSGINQQLSNEINALGQNDLQKKLSQIEQEKQAWIEKGADVAQAEQLAQQKIRQAHEETESKLNEIRQSVAALDNSEFENKLANIEKEKNAWIQAGMEKAEAEQLAQQKVSKIIESEAEQRAQAEEQYAEQVAKAKEQYIKQIQAAQEEADRKNKQERQEALNLLKSEAQEFNAFMKGGYQGLQDYRYKQLIKQGVNPEYLRQMTPELMDAYRAAQEKADRSFLPNWRDRNSPKYVEPPEVKVPDILKDVPKSIDKVSSSSDKAAKSLDNLADAADKAAGNDNEREVPREVSRVEEPIKDYWTPPPGRGGAVGAYQQPDGSTLIQNMYPDVKHKDPLIGAAIPVGETGVDMGNLEKYAKDFPDIAAAIERGATDLNKSIEDITSPLNELPTNIQSTSENFSEMPTAVQSAAESLNELPTAVQGVMEQISAIEPQQLPQDTELPSILSEVAQSFSQLPTVIQTASDSLNGLPVMVSGLKENLTPEVSQLFLPMSESLTTVTVKFSDLGAALDSFLSQLNSASINQSQSQPIEVNNTISIDEAHAWDYDHIQELAEKVADIIEPILLRSIGGDSNSY